MSQKTIIGDSESLEIMAYLEAVEGDYWFGRTTADRKESELFVKQMGKNN